MKINFKPVDRAHRALIHSWLAAHHVQEWFYGEGLQNTIKHLDQFLEGATFFQYWLASEGSHPFAFLITTEVSKPGDSLASWCVEEGKAITLDMLIGNLNYLGKGLAPQVIKAFILQQFSDVQEVLIDPEASNARAVHVYEKVGFSIVGEFIPSHSPNPHYMMRLSVKNLLAKEEKR